MSGPARSDELTTEKAMAALDTFRDAGASKVFFTGGEPFSRKDFPALLDRTVALGMRASVITNATLLRNATLEVVKQLQVQLGISIDGVDETTNDAIRGQGSFRQAIEALKQCRDSGISTTLYVTVTAANVKQLGALARLARELGCGGVHFNEVTIAGHALHFSDELALSEEQKKRLPEMVAQTASNVFAEKLSLQF
jgi:MoaA/NifB/PqqE/SkfB family radical SAM enzyme